MVRIKTVDKNGKEKHCRKMVERKTLDENDKKKNTRQKW